MNTATIVSSNSPSGRHSTVAHAASGLGVRLRNVIGRCSSDKSFKRGRKRRNRSDRRRGLAAGYRLMAWRSFRSGDLVGAEMHSRCSWVLRNSVSR
jgi:hypothetical protein